MLLLPFKASDGTAGLRRNSGNRTIRHRENATPLKRGKKRRASQKAPYPLPWLDLPRSELRDLRSTTEGGPRLLRLTGPQTQMRRIKGG